jgi:hypothetical protein
MHIGVLLDKEELGRGVAAAAAAVETAIAA